MMDKDNTRRHNPKKAGSFSVETKIGSGVYYTYADIFEMNERLLLLMDHLNLEYVPEKTTTKYIPATLKKRPKKKATP